MEYTLEDIVDLKIGRTPPRKESQWFNTTGDGYKWVSIKDMGACGRYISDTSEYLIEQAKDNFNIPIVERGTVLLSFKLTVGRVCIATDTMLTNEAIAQLPIRNKKQVDAKYLYYYLKGYNFNQLGSTSSIATAINSTYLRRMKIELPDIEQQKRVAAVLSSLDDRIEKNQQINNNLQQQAESLFAEYFLNYTDVPLGWRKGNLLDIADYLNGLAMQKFRPKEGEIGLPVLKIKELRQGFCDTDSELCSPSIRSDYLVHDGDVIFSWSGSLLVDFWCGGDCGLNQHLFKVTSTRYEPWFYYLWTNYHLARFVAIAADKATTMGHIKREDLAKAEVLIPSADDYNKIGATLRPLLSMVISNRIENKKLSTLRGSLLPRLMSAEIDVSKVEV